MNNRYCLAILVILALALLSVSSQALETKRLTLLRAFTKPNLRGSEPRGFSWSRDDSRIAYVWNDEGWSYSEVWILEPDSGDNYRVTDFESIELAQVREGNAAEKDVEEKRTEKELLEELHNRGGVGSPAWGSDGMLYVPWAGDIWRLPADKPKANDTGKTEYAKPELFLDLEGWVGGLDFSEDGKKLGFIYDNSFWVCDIRTGAMREVAQGAGYQGQGGFSWSPDGRFIAFNRVDSTGLRQINMVDFVSENIAAWPVNRSRPGDTIDRVQIGIADMERTGMRRNEPRMLKLGDSAEVYVYDMDWSPSGKYFLVGELSKDTQSYDLFIAEPATGRTAKVWTERDEAWYNRTTGPRWLGDNAIVFCSEKDGWGHLYKLDISSWQFPPEQEKPAAGDKPDEASKENEKQGAEVAGKKDEKPKEEPPDGIKKPFVPQLPPPTQLTKGDFEVTQLYIPKDASWIAYAASKFGPDRRDLFIMTPDGSPERRITTGAGVNTFDAWYPVRGGAISWLEKKAIISSTTLYQAPSSTIVDIADGKKVQDIEGGFLPEYYTYGWVVPELVRIQNEKDNELFSARIYRPPYAQKGDKRPVIVYVHGAGYAQTALRSVDWMDPVSIYMADTLGYIVVDIDYRGSSGYGRKWRTDVFRRLGELEVSDAVSAAHYVINSGEGDPNCVGVWGWSYGGFLTNMIMFRAPETFKAGVAVAAVNKWANYNSWYVSERLGDPAKNKEAYKASDPIEYADKLQGSLLMVHGIRDDNVLFQDFAQLTMKLTEAGKHVDMMVYPQMSHGPSSDENMVHITETVAWYFLKHFGLGPGAQGPDPKDSLDAYAQKKKQEKEEAKEGRRL